MFDGCNDLSPAIPITCVKDLLSLIHGKILRKALDLGHSRDVELAASAQASIDRVHV
jgi:hypothetical protein